MVYRIILPPLTSEFSTSSELGGGHHHRPHRTQPQAQQLVDYTAQPYEAFISVTVMYLLINVTVMYLMRRLEDRKSGPGFIGGK